MRQFFLTYCRASLNLSSTVDNVDQIYNGLSDEYGTLYPYMEDVNNEGGMMLLTKEELGDKQARTRKRMTYLLGKKTPENFLLAGRSDFFWRHCSIVARPTIGAMKIWAQAKVTIEFDTTSK